MPRQTSNTDPKTVIATLRKSLENVPVSDMITLFGEVRDDLTDQVLEEFDNAWDQVERLSENYRELNGQPLPMPHGLAHLFAGAPAASAGRAERPRTSRPDAWYTHEIATVVRFGGSDGVSDDFIGDFIEARGGDAEHATTRMLPALGEQGFVTRGEDGAWRLANQHPDVWYDFRVIGFINQAGAPVTTKQIHDHIIEEGGHGAEVVSSVLPRLESAGRVREVGAGTWDVSTRRPDAWYDHTITAFVAGADPGALPTTKQIHDHVIAQGGHGAAVVTEALPRLVDAGHLAEARDGVWDITRRRPDAWYDFAIVSMFDQQRPSPMTTKQIHDRVIELGGHGADVATRALPRLASAGKLTDHGDGTWDLSARRPEAWYQHLVMSAIRAASPAGLPTMKQLHDRVIAEGGHGALVATDILPGLVRAGELVEVEPGVHDLASRPTDVWYDQTVLDFVRENDGATTMQIGDHVTDSGGHGAEVAQSVLPRLERAGLVWEVEMGTWEAGTGVPHAVVEQQLLSGFREHTGTALGTEACVEFVDDDLAEFDIVEPALHRLLEAGFIEADGEGDETEWALKRARPRAKDRARSAGRRRRTAARR